jgi:hypothetical protein
MRDFNGGSFKVHQATPEAVKPRTESELAASFGWGDLGRQCGGGGHLNEASDEKPIYAPGWSVIALILSAIRL